MKFRMLNKFSGNTSEFTDKNPPKWLSEGGRMDSTMDNRWFWEDYVLTLGIGQMVQTDFSEITRID